MSQQGERPTAGDDWWNRLYDESAADTGPAAAADTLDDRFDSAVDTVGPEDSPGAWWDPSRRGVAPWESSAAPRTPADPVGDPPVFRTGGVAGAGAGAGSASAASAASWASPASTPRTRADFTELPASTVPPAPAVPPASAGSPPPAPAGPPGRDLAGEPSAAPPPQPPAPPTVPVAAAGAAPEQQTRTAGRRGPVPWGRRKESAGRSTGGYVGDRPPTYDAEPTALPTADPQELGGLVPDTVLDGARYGAFTLRAASVRGDSARYRGEHRRDALLTARFGTGEGALVLVAVATGARAAEGAHLAAADACRWIGGAVGRSHARLAEDIRAGRRGDLKSGLHRLTDRSFGRLRARAAELGVPPEEYTASLRCLLLPADHACRTRVFFGVGAGGLFRLRDGGWHDLEPSLPDAFSGEPVVGYGSPPPETREGDRLTMDLGVTTPPSPHIDEPVPPPAEPFRFRASVARPGDTLLLCSSGLADPLRGEPALADELAERWAETEPPGLAAYLADTQLRVKGYADDRTACAVWEA
ncbi:hypothetical protein E3E14_01615 [Streptomyces sp. ICN441]|uniref:protein phosphatase 2C domain-containing protein n=1 Tax=Streptomyces sp. ICN441 TaxID=2558286 RepID=UPI00106A8BA3|nr:protein phosphatase 2C domain-containing protein [Streptomyces sp. ICN441]TFE58191.1 hypothetical protein E3E14_01615 [Streptomyces sp. ICN441]